MISAAERAETGAENKEEEDKFYHFSSLPFKAISSRPCLPYGKRKSAESITNLF